MTLDSKGIAFIKAREALRTAAYKDSKGIATIGYGTTIYPNGRKVRIGDVCTTEQADAYFLYDSHKFENAVSQLVVNMPSIPLTQNQFNALVSITYNIGEGQKGLAGSTLLKRVNSTDRNNKELISEAFLRWNKITVIEDGKPVLKPIDGLTNRRKKEVELYFS